MVMALGPAEQQVRALSLLACHLPLIERQSDHTDLLSYALR